MRIAFAKMHGAGNDFVVIDHREPFLPGERRALLARLCDRRRGVGADGVLLLERDPECDFAMVYYNADGGPADFCGNGARCLARFALDLGLGGPDGVRFRSAAGIQHAAPTADGGIALRFGTVAAAGPVRVATPERTFDGVRVVAGVPHFVVPVERVEDVPLMAWSPGIRSHAAFGAAGTNVDFVARHADGRVAMRTYERGVEGETLACGSGAIATAVWAVGEGLASPVTVRTAGGDDLVVALEPVAEGHSATLTGPAVTVFRGEWREG